MLRISKDLWEIKKDTQSFPEREVHPYTAQDVGILPRDRNSRNYSSFQPVFRPNSVQIPLLAVPTSNVLPTTSWLCPKAFCCDVTAGPQCMLLYTITPYTMQQTHRSIPRFSEAFQALMVPHGDTPYLLSMLVHWSGIALAISSDMTFQISEVVSHWPQW